MSRDLQADIANVFSRVELNRRDLVVSGLAAGFALAVQPVSAQTISFPRAEAIAVTALDRFGNASAPKVLGLR